MFGFVCVVFDSDGMQLLMDETDPLANLIRPGKA